MDVDIVTAYECGNFGSDDDVHLAFVAKEGRCLVTRNRNHFIALTVKFFEERGFEANQEVENQPH